MRYPDDVPTLTDGVVTLRAHLPGDLPRIAEQCRDPEMAAWTTVPSPYADSDAVQWTTRMLPQGWETDTTYGFAVEHRGLFAGSADLRVRAGGGEAEIGYGLHPDARGQGVMRRALALLLDWGFQRGVEVVHWRAFVGNWASRRTVWSLGFSFGPTIPRLLPHRDGRRDAWTAWLGAGDDREPTERWLVPPVLEAPGVRLRPWRDCDAERLVGIGNDPLMREWLPASPVPRSTDEVPAYLTRVREVAARGRRVAWCVADPDTDLACGNLALFDLEGDEDALTAQVGYWSHPAGRGRGMMTTALATARDWAFRTVGDGGLGVRRLFLLTSVRNTASARVAERAGFTRVGVERGSAPLADGSYEDNALYDLLRP